MRNDNIHSLFPKRYCYLRFGLTESPFTSSSSFALKKKTQNYIDMKYLTFIKDVYNSSLKQPQYLNLCS